MEYIGITIFLLYIWAFFIEPELLSVKHYKVSGLNGKKIVFISDFHVGKFEEARLKRIVRKVNELNPDLVLSGGDYIKEITEKYTMPIEKQAEILAEINAPVVSVLGNHDAFFDKYRVQKALERNGIKVLRNSNTKIGDISIAGVEDMQTSIPQPETALEGTDGYTILLSHTPDIYPDVKQDVDLILAGHVHGGQVRVPFIGALICPSKYGTIYSCGDFKETENRMIVTKGLGTSKLTVRFNAIPEIVVLEE